MVERFPKLRGGRRYFRNLQHWPDSIQIQLGDGKWYDLWHEHPDYRGWSKRGTKARRAHLVVLFSAFHRVLKQVACQGEPAQVFVAVTTKDFRGDALYVHTPNPNPNGMKFPYAFGGYRWDGFSVPSWLEQFVDPDQFEVGETVFNNETQYVVIPRGRHGRPHGNGAAEA